MAIRQRMKQVTAISEETTYGDGDKAVLALNDAPMSFDVGKNMITLNRKSGQMIDNQYKNITGRKTPSVTIESPLYPELLTLLADYLTVIGTEEVDDYDTSYCIRQLTPSSGDAGDGIEAVGCKPESITLSQTDGFWNISVPFAVQKLYPEKAVTTLTGLDLEDDRPTSIPIRFDVIDATATIEELHDEITTSTTGAGAISIDLEELSLTLNFNRADDVKIFRNSQERVNDLICSLSGEVSLTYTWDDTNPLENEIYEDGKKFRFIYDVAGGLAISVDFIMSNFDKPDDTTCVYSATITGMIVDQWAIGLSDLTTT